MVTKKFVAPRQATSAKFWGKIFGTKRDYFIIEADVEPGETEEILEKHEPKKQPGVNKKIYFATNDRTSHLLQLWMQMVGPNYLCYCLKFLFKQGESLTPSQEILKVKFTPVLFSKEKRNIT